MSNWTGFNSLRPRPNRRHFADDIFKYIFENENEWISPRISLKFDPKFRINNIPALVHIMAWRRPGDKPLSEQMMVSLLTHICVTRPQWVNIGKPFQMKDLTVEEMEMCNAMVEVFKLSVGFIIWFWSFGEVRSVLWLGKGRTFSISNKMYPQTSNISRTLVANKMVYHSDVVGASPVAAPTTFSFFLHKTLHQLIGQKHLQDETRNI